MCQDRFSVPIKRLEIVQKTSVYMMTYSARDGPKAITVANTDSQVACTTPTAIRAAESSPWICIQLNEISNVFLINFNILRLRSCPQFNIWVIATLEWQHQKRHILKLYINNLPCLIVPVDHWIL